MEDGRLGKKVLYVSHGCIDLALTTDCNTGEEQCRNPGHSFRNHCQNGSLYCKPWAGLPELTPSPDLVKRIDNLIERSSDGDFKALDINQVLVNEYSPGQGISVRHTDHRVCCMLTPAS